MRTYDPQQTETEQELRDVANYWLQRCYIAEVELKGMRNICKERGVAISVTDLVLAMNQVDSNGS